MSVTFFIVLTILGLTALALMVYGAVLIMRKGVTGAVKTKEIRGLYGQKSGK